MRALPILFILLLAACSASGGNDAVNPKPTLAVAQAAMSGGAPQVALQVCSSIAQREPKNVQAMICEGDALTILGRVDEAEAVFRRAQLRDPKDPMVLMGLGRLRVDPDPPGAELLFLQVLSTNPNNAQAWNDLGIARDLQGRHDEAQQAYARALALAPDMRAAEVNLALSLAISGRADEAVRRLRQLAAAPNITPKLRQNLAAALAMANKPDEAARMLRGDMTQTEIDQAIAGYQALTTQPSP
jgi:Flp pilus assembly protein TadD